MFLWTTVSPVLVVKESDRSLGATGTAEPLAERGERPTPAGTGAAPRTPQTPATA